MSRRPCVKSTMEGTVELVLQEARDQVLQGKGEQRHGRGRRFEEQATPKILDLFGPGYAAGQAAKKVEEALGLLEVQPAIAKRNELDEIFARADRDLLGAIGYLAILAAWLRERRVR